MSYILPQVQVFQIFTQIPQNVVQNLNAFVFGPNYQLFRYEEAGERALTSLGTYDGTETAYAWPNYPTGATLDLGYTKVYAENVWAEYFHFDATYGFEIVSGERNKIRMGAGYVKTANEYVRASGLLRDVKIGDRVRYEFVDGATTYTGTTKVVGLEADEVPPVVGTLTNKASNKGSVAASNLATVDVTAGAENTSTLAAVVEALDGTEFTGSLSNGLVSDDIVVTITTAGAAGTAKASVVYASGAYSAFDVPIEVAAGTDGKLYIGNNAVLVFAAAGSDAVFDVGDSFSLELSAGFTRLTADNIVVDAESTFTGPQATTYMLEVVRGGVFDRAVTVSNGIQASAGTLSVAVGSSAASDWALWAGGDIDDEYVLRCTKSGTAATAEFSLSSLTGDDDTLIIFGGTSDVTIGTRGLVAAIGAASYVVGDSWVIRVNASRPVIRVSDTAGVDGAKNVLITSPGAADFALTIGSFGVSAAVTANLNTEGGTSASGGLRLGDVYYIPVEPATEAGVKTIVLADDVVAGIEPGDVLDVYMYVVKPVVELTARREQTAPEYNWEATDAALTVHAGLQVQDSGWVAGDGTMPWLNVYRADLFATYRALLQGAADAIHVIENVSDVAAQLGTVHPDNPLAQGVYNALLNSGNRAVYYMGVPSDDLDGWSYVLDRASLSTDVYAFAPMTQNEEVLELVEAHIDAMSTETEKHWRIGFVSAEAPSSLNVYTHLSNPTGAEYLATISEMTNPLTGAVENILVKFVEGTEDLDPSTFTACLTDVRAGDKVRIAYSVDEWGDPTYSEFEVAEVLTNASLRLESGPAATIDRGSKVEVWHPYTLTEMAQAIAAKSRGFYNRRIYNVFPGILSSNGVTMTGEFGAAAVAGLTSSVAPQQPITNVELNGFDDLPLVYRTFNRTQLNKMAEYGTMIIMQDMPGSTVYVRHQVSTKASGMNMNETELSLVKNLDSVSYYFANRFAPYIGRYNITPDLLEILNNILEDGIAFLGSMTGTGLIGPQILLDDTEIVGIQQHPSLLDHVVGTVNLALPKPFNVLQLRLVV